MLRHYATRILARWPLHTSYESIVQDVRTILGKPPLRSTERVYGNWLQPREVVRQAVLCVDATGVGRAVVDMLRRAQLRAQLVAITLTAGARATTANGGWNVPKRDLVSVMQLLLQGRRFQVAKNLK